MRETTGSLLYNTLLVKKKKKLTDQRANGDADLKEGRKKKAPLVASNTRGGMKNSRWEVGQSSRNVANARGASISSTQQKEKESKLHRSCYIAGSLSKGEGKRNSQCRWQKEN